MYQRYEIFIYYSFKFNTTNLLRCILKKLQRNIESSRLITQGGLKDELVFEEPLSYPNVLFTLRCEQKKG